MSLLDDAIFTAEVALLPVKCVKKFMIGGFGVYVRISSRGLFQER
jgi:hypothetical protein